jgi:hypothetical protein
MAQTQHQATGWVGWIYFAGIMMMLAGIFQAIAGLVALFQDEIYYVGVNNLLVFDYTGWGWTHLIIGLVLFFSSLSVMAGGMWGRVLGVFLAGLSAIANFGFLAAYPIWSTIIIVVDVFIIYALIVHGHEAKPSSM